MVLIGNLSWEVVSLLRTNVVKYFFYKIILTFILISILAGSCSV